MQSENWNGMIVSKFVKKYSSPAMYKIYNLEYKGMYVCDFSRPKTYSSLSLIPIYISRMLDNVTSFLLCYIYSKNCFINGNNVALVQMYSIFYFNFFLYKK